MDAKTFGAFLARMRKSQGLTQAELAQQLHVTDKAVSRWERGVGLPDINTLEPLADALGLTLADLMHCRDPQEADIAPEVPLEDFFTLLRRQQSIDWRSVRAVLFWLSAALAIWGILACPGRMAVHWRTLSNGNLQADGWLPSWVFFPLFVGIEFLSLELWNTTSSSVSSGVAEITSSNITSRTGRASSVSTRVRRLSTPTNWSYSPSTYT